MGLIYLALVLAPFQYGFDATTAIEYETAMTFDGFIPVLGGTEGLVVVTMGLSVVGEAPARKNAIQAVSEITSFKITFNDATLPFGLESVTEFFPRTKIELSPSGKILKTDAPDTRPPIRLPGLDVKRFPDITYVPIVFPKTDLSVGSEWTFEKPFSDGPMKYRCKLLKIDGDLITVAMKIDQEYETLENEALEVVDEREEAVRSVKTVMTGQGTVVFDVREGLVHSLKMVAESTGEEFSMDGEMLKTRKLSTTMELVRKVDSRSGESA
ncbi:MAG: hypothetical protein IH944_04590 [Armatimonadetes bacterium]|nr:hypothetical protein [Armatimonadota bacterium]